MPTLEALRHTLATVEELRSIVRTMKALAAVSIHQYERAVSALIDYDRAVRQGLAVVLREQAVKNQAQGMILPDEAPDVVPTASTPSAIGVVAFGSDHGLCGRFNEALAEYVAITLRDRPEVQRRVLVVGIRQAGALEE
ncbi:MAG TPA: F0F1 ATP synthase subunit gamma, partial [Candidatus Competibacteraceae bacterium]|nr:F0F1 ATP synthase subunit gamma [Candidatus Competibacteraceae bacterium]